MRPTLDESKVFYGNAMDSFDAIYIINLPTRPDRKAEMIEQLRGAGIDPGSAMVKFFDAVRPADAGDFPSLGARGCFLSHVGVLKSAMAAGHRRVLVLEDDANFVKDFPRRFEPVAAALESREWGMAYLGALAVKPPCQVTPPLESIPATSSVMGTHMFAVAGPAIPQIIAYFEAMLRRSAGDPQGGPMHVDGAYSWFRKSHPAMVTLLCEPALGYQRPSRTDVHQTKWFDRTPIVRDLVAVLRRSKPRLG